MLQPSRTKYRKHQKGRNRGLAYSGNVVVFGNFGLKALENCRLSSAQIESARRVISRSIKRGGKVWIRVFPDIVITKKPAEVRMGGGKGSPECFVSNVRAGAILFELEFADRSVAEEALLKAAAKLPMKTCFVLKEVGVNREND